MLGYFGPEARSAAPDLIEAVRRGTVPGSGRQRPGEHRGGADVTVPILIDRFVNRGCQHLTGMGSFIRHSVDKALARVGEPAVPALLKILNGPDAGMRVCAAYVLGEIGPAARAAVPELIRAIEHAGARGVARYAREAGDPSPRPDRARGQGGRPGAERLAREAGFSDFDAVIALDRIGVPPVRKLLEAFLATVIPASPTSWPCSGRKPARRFPPSVPP